MNKKKFLISTHGFDMGIGGLKVLHKLCHLLNEAGEDAYLIPVNFNQEFAIYEKYNVKMVTQEVLDNLNDVIVIYPESWFGNYLNAPNVVRWLIGPPSEDHVITWKDSDLWFWYIPFYLNDKYKKDTDNFLCITEQHRDVFYDMKFKRSGTCWSLRKAQDKIKPDQYIHPKDSYFIPYHAAGDIIGLSKLFNSKELFYCYDNQTYIMIQALMCNTDVIVVPVPNIDKQRFQMGYDLNKYVAYGIEDLERSRSIRPQFFDNLDMMEHKSLLQLDNFIKKCHDYFS